MKVAVTGGAGFIGRATVEALLSRGHEVLVIDDLSTSGYKALGETYNIEKKHPGRLFIVVEDVSKKGVLREAVKSVGWKGVDAIVHLAAIASVELCNSEPRRCREVNIRGTINVARDSIIVGARHLVYASSAAVYGNPSSLPVSEDHPLRPISLYGYTKLRGEEVLLSLASSSNVKVSILRYFNVYGPGMNPAYAGVILRFVEAFARGEKPVIYGDGAQTRDFVHVRDVAEANIAVIEEGVGGVYNIGTGVETSIIDLCRTIARLASRRCEPVYKEPRKGDIRRSVADISKARENLKWSPKVSLKQGLAELLSSYNLRANPNGSL